MLFTTDSGLVVFENLYKWWRLHNVVASVRTEIFQPVDLFLYLYRMYYLLMLM